MILSFPFFWNSLLSILFFFTGIYLELVLKKEYGTSRDWQFLWKKKHVVSGAILKKEYHRIKEQESHCEFHEKIIDQALLEQEKNNLVMIINNIAKEFSNGTKAVDGVSLKMYQG